VEWEDGYWAERFFLPIGSIKNLEQEVYILMQHMDQGYNSIMDMPYSRRQRIFEKRVTELQQAKNKNNSTAGMRTKRAR